MLLVQFASLVWQKFSIALKYSFQSSESHSNARNLVLSLIYSCGSVSTTLAILKLSLATFIAWIAITSKFLRVGHWFD